MNFDNIINNKAVESLAKDDSKQAKEIKKIIKKIKVE